MPAAFFQLTILGITGNIGFRRHKCHNQNGHQRECKVYRSGVITVIDVDDVVTGDLVLLQSGDKIPADGVLIH